MLEVVVGGVSTCHTSEFVSNSNLAHLLIGDRLTKIGHVRLLESDVEGVG